MIPVNCRVSHKPDEGSYGDCLRACIASIMELDAELVPHFADGGVGAGEAWTAVREWLAIRGYTLFVANYPPIPLAELLEMMGTLNPDCHYMLFGHTGQANHVVVARGDKIVHNPAWIACSLTGPLEVEGERAWSVWLIAHR